MREIYLIRHAESVANVGGATADNLNIPLTENGKNQAEILARNFAKNDISPDAIFTSNYARTFATAAPILRANHQIPTVLSMSLGEISYLAPRPNSTYEERAPFRARFWARATDDFDFRENEAESLNDFFTRAEKSFALLTNFAAEKSESDAKIFAFSHEMTIAAILALASGVSRARFLRDLTATQKVESKIKNTEVVKLVLASSALESVQRNIFEV